MLFHLEFCTAAFGWNWEEAEAWAEATGFRKQQLPVPGTCALVAVTKCLEAQHRKEFEAVHGAKSFPCRAAAPRKLRQVCFRELIWNPSTGKRERTWDPKVGARYLGRVLRKMIQLGGARTTNAPPPAPFLLPLADWEGYHRDDHGLTPEVAKQLLHRRGPCVGTLFATEDFYRMDASLFSHRAAVAFRGCPREKREEVRGSDPDAAMHAVVCYAYRHNKQGKLLVLVLDNQQATGPSKWVHFDEFDSFYVLYVRPLPPRHLLGRSERPVYPVSGTGYWAGSLQMGNGEEQLETGAEALETAPGGNQLPCPRS
ncbi:hypothetical protein C2845_PM09G04130 [Panicum miliaceum]|uniref:Uncharacterized protein n=1 Tax=Panicum miliaceum TaxID=4540 RepID=A0A3L6S1T0_PANMI|nr:hypothetical protein C2845_PM09G04130 [Panicum miliaceum]